MRLALLGRTDECIRGYVRGGGAGEEGLLGLVGAGDVFRRGGEFQGTREGRADAGGFFGGGGQPLIQGGADAAALGRVFDDDEADEIAAGGEARAHQVVAREHAVENEGHVVVFEELGYGEHAAGRVWGAGGESLPSCARPDRV